MHNFITAVAKKLLLPVIVSKVLEILITGQKKILVLPQKQIFRIDFQLLCRMIDTKPVNWSFNIILSPDRTKLPRIFKECTFFSIGK